jgi:hypothetical protein
MVFSKGAFRSIPKLSYTVVLWSRRKDVVFAIEVETRYLDGLGVAADHPRPSLLFSPSRADGGGRRGYLFQSRVGGLGCPWCIEPRRPAAQAILAGDVKQVAAGAAKFNANLIAPQFALPEAGEVIKVDGGAVHDSSLK